MTINQISVFLENRAGQLAEICKILSDNKIDLRAINIAETADYGVLRLIADKPREAVNILLGQGYILNMTPVVAVDVPDHPGGLAELLAILAEAGMDVEYMYSVFTQKAGRASMVLRVDDAGKLVSLLAGHDIAPVSGPELGVEENG